MKIRFLTIKSMLLMAALTFAPLAAHAGAAITAAYKIVAVQATATGSLVSLDVTVTNSGTQSLTSLVMQQTDPTRIGAPQNTLNVGNLAVGGQFVGTWALTTDIPANQVQSSMPIYLQAQAVDANNATIAVPVEGVAQ